MIYARFLSFNSPYSCPQTCLCSSLPEKRFMGGTWAYINKRGMGERRYCFRPFQDLRKHNSRNKPNFDKGPRSHDLGPLLMKLSISPEEKKWNLL